jgi:pimeloyl-ACP methyl ester carboxylesterase
MFFVGGRRRGGFRTARAWSAPLVAVLVATFVVAAAVAAHGPPALDGCVRPSATTKLVRFGSGGRLAGVVFGHGRSGVVLANQSDEDLCSWLPFARATAAQGLRVLAFDYGSGAPEREVAAAADALRERGSSRIVLLGASEGAKATILAAAAQPKLAAAVVALSPERYLRRVDVLPAARRLRVPTLFAVSERDPYSAQDTPLLARAAGTRARLVTVPGDAHGVDLLGGPPAATVGAAAFDFLLTYGPRRHPPSLASECGRAVAADSPPATAVAFTAGDGVQLHGVVLGHGRTTVVLAHEYPSSLCGWFPYAAELARGGDRVLLFDQRARGTRLDLDVVAAVEKARELGAARVVAMGASLGGAATLVAAGRDCFDLSGVVSASGETDLRTYGRGVPPLYAVPFEHAIAAPLLVIGSKDDPLVGEADVIRLVARASSSSKRSLLLDGSGHGWDLLQGPTASRSLRDAVTDFVAHVGPPVATGCR